MSNEFWVVAVASVIVAVALGAVVAVVRQRNRLGTQLADMWEENVRTQAEASRVRAEADQRVTLQVEHRMRAIRSKLEVDNAHLVSQALVGETTAALQTAIRTAVEKKFNRVTQEFTGSLSDEADGLVRELNVELCEKVWDAFQNFKELSSDSPYIMPDGCKLAYTKGVRTVIVVEQKPQVRTVSFAADLINSREVKATGQKTAEGNLRYSLAFPYVYFVIAFDEGEYSNYQVYFRNKPLTSVREHVHLPPLPNIHRGENLYRPVCMGNDFEAAAGKQSNIARQCNRVVADFWQRTFSNDLGNGQPQDTDKRIRDYAVWQANTAADPLFILGVAWPKGVTIKGVVEAALEERDHDHPLDPVDQVIRERLEEGVQRLTSRIKDEIQSAKTKGLSQFDLDRMSRSLLEETVLAHATRVFNQCAK